jgi:hypothetical protein
VENYFIPQDFINLLVALLLTKMVNLNVLL